MTFQKSKNWLAVPMVAYLLMLCTQESAAGWNPWEEEKQARLITLVLDNSSVSPTTTEDLTSGAIQKVLQMASELRGGEYEVEVAIVLTTQPSSEIFSGSPKELIDQAALVLEKSKLSNTCSDLGLSFKQVVTGYELRKPDRADVLVVSPAINVPFPCGEDAEDITLPQKVDNEYLLETAKFSDSVTHLMVEPDQEGELLEFYKKHGLWMPHNKADRATSSVSGPTVDIKIMGVASSKSLLSKQRPEIFSIKE